MTVRVFSDQAGTTAASANDNIGKVEDLSKFDSDGVSSTTGPYLSVDANGFGSADILGQGGDVVQTFTNAIADGSALVVGTSKCIFFSNVNVEAGGTLTIGPAGDMINTNGLNLIGKVVSVATTTKVLTTAEQNSITTFFAERGASSVVVNDETVYDVNSVEADLVLDFNGSSFYRNVPHYFKLGGTYSTFADAFMGSNPKLTYDPGSASSSQSTMVNSAGHLVWAPHNLVTYSEDITGYDAVGTATIIDSETFSLSGIAADPLQGITIPSADLNGTYTVRAQIWSETDAGTTINFGARIIGIPDVTTAHTLQNTPTWEELETDLTGATQFRGIKVASTSAATVKIRNISVYRSDLGGMAPVPGAATGFETYVPTNGNEVHLPRVGHHVYNGSAWVNEGLLLESEARTNLLLNTSTLSTQSATVTAVPHTLSFTGTGTVTLSGVSTDGPLVGTGTGENNRVSLTFTPTAGTLTLTVSGTVSNAQLEAGTTPSSYIPTSGSTVTRGGQSLTVPPAEFGWPEPEYIGPELVDNSDFSLGDNGDWSAAGNDASSVTFNSGVARVAGNALAYQAIPTVAGRVYYAQFEITDATSTGDFRLGTNITNFDIYDHTPNAVVGSYSLAFVAVSSTTYINLKTHYPIGDTSKYTDFDNISVREINPLSVSIQMDGRMTYADEGVFQAQRPYKWNLDGSNFIDAVIRSDANLGYVLFRQREDGTNHTRESASGIYLPGILVPFNIASRHGSTFVNSAMDGTALTASTTPTALPDLSNTDLQIAQDFMGTIGTFRQFAGDIGDAGLEEATS